MPSFAVYGRPTSSLYHREDALDLFVALLDVPVVLEGGLCLIVLKWSCC